MTNLAIIQEYYAYFNAKNWAGMLSLLSPMIRHEPNQGEVRIGIDLFRDFLTKMDEAYEERLENMLFFTTNQDDTRFACEFVVHGVYKKAEEGMPAAHHQNYELPAAAFLEVKEAKIIRITTYYNLPLWLQLVQNT